MPTLKLRWTAILDATKKRRRSVRMLLLVGAKLGGTGKPRHRQAMQGDAGIWHHPPSAAIDGMGMVTLHGGRTMAYTPRLLKIPEEVRTAPGRAAVHRLSSEEAARQTDAEREERKQGLRLFRGLNARREGGPVDGLQFQEEQRAEW